MSDRGGKTPLYGLRVIDLTRILAGPYCTMMLGDMGAEVIKIEDPEHGDDTRTWGPFVDGWSSYFLGVNRSKKSVTLNLKSRAGADALRRLIERADVLVENFRPRSLTRMGFGYEDVRRLNRSIIYCSISGYGQTGAKAELPGYDPVIQAEAGLMDVTGFPGGPATRVGIAITDFLAGLQAVQGILLALLHKRSTGEGQYIDISLFDSLMSAMLMQTGILQAGETPARMGNEHPSIAPYETFSTSEGIVMVAVGNDRLWRQFCEALGASTLCEDRRFSSNADRVRHRQMLRRELEPLFLLGSADEIIEKLRRAQVPCGRVQSLDTALDDPQLQHRDMILSFAQIPGFNMIAHPAHLSRTPAVPTLPPPRLGEHTAHVLQSLGYSAEEIEAIVEPYAQSPRD